MRQLIAIAGILLLAAGCRDSNLPKTAPVSGVVTFQGKPLANAEVVFIPDGDARSASGRTDANGRYELMTFSPGDGAAPGKYRIIVTARGPARALAPGEGAGMPGEMAQGELITPAKYAAPETSGLTHEVVSGRNEVNLSLEE